jgi:adenylate kinase
MHNICLIGRTGSGKSTLGSHLAQTFGFPVVASGDIAREIARDDRSVSLALDSGAVAPEVPIRTEVKRRIEEAEVHHGGWILDGFPRSVAQLIALYQWVKTPVIFVHVDVMEHVCIERLMERGREDDSPDAVARRLESFNKVTQPVLDMLPKDRVVGYYSFSNPASVAEMIRTMSEDLYAKDIRF